MGADDFFSVVYALGAKEAGGVQHWEETLEKWAEEVEEAEKLNEFMRRRHDKTWIPTAEELPSQAGLMQMEGPAPLREG